MSPRSAPAPDMSKPYVLDLFCGAGGAAMGYRRAGLGVVGVDIKPQPNYPFTFYQADALAFPLEGFSLIHASPPCQRYSEMYNPARGSHADYIARVRDRLRGTGTSWVIENTPRAPLINPITLCGSMFGLGVRRHRLFESSFPLKDGFCEHYLQPRKYLVYDHGKWYYSRVAPVYGQGGGKAKSMAAEAMGINWMSRRELVEAIPPAYTDYIGRQFLEVANISFRPAPAPVRLPSADPTGAGRIY